MHAHLLQDIGLCVIAATVMAFVARLLRQPLILAYIGAGLIIGPPGFQWVKGEASITQISELGLAFLLFIVGLEIDLKHLIRSGKISAIVGTVQVVGCALLGWGAALALGFRGLPAAYLGVATAFSSTMIVVKLLSDKGELDTVAGRITLGVLLMQDVLAIVVLAVQPNISNPALLPLALSMVKGFALVAGAIAASRYALPVLFRLVAKTPEVLLIAAISWCFLVSYAAVKADFSIAMGALIAGVSMSTFPYSLDVIAKIRSLRDFFVTLFFVSLGMQISVGSASMLIAAGVLSAVVLLGRFLPVLPALQALKYGRRVGILTSLSLAQVSEFSLVIVSLGLGLGHVDKGVVSIVAISLVVTSTLSTYLIQGNQRIAGFLVRFLARRGWVDEQERETKSAGKRHHAIVVVGCYREASSLVPLLVEDAKDFLVVDFSPEIHRKLTEMKVPCLYGDISHADTLEHAGLEEAKIILSTISDDFLRGTSNLTLLRQLRAMSPHAKIIVRAEKVKDAKVMYEAGADYVLLPRHLIAEQIRDLLRRAEDGTLDQIRQAEQEALSSRQEVVA
jgi:Kef-type K+ transport system membrane component KefB/Trk K+ transport system NAD-binding subunit